MVIPRERLSEEALDGLIEEFILREGTDYGLREYSLEEKKNKILSQLDSGRICIVFDLKEETCSLMVTRHSGSA